MNKVYIGESRRRFRTGTRVVSGDAHVENGGGDPERVRVPDRDAPAEPPVFEVKTFYVVVTCHAGPADTARLVQDIIASKGDYNVDLLVYDDCTAQVYENKDYARIHAMCDAHGWKFVRAPSKHGIRGFASLVHGLLEDAVMSMLEGDLLVLLRDDMRLSSSFFGQVVRAWTDAPEKPCVIVPARDRRFDRTRYGMRQPIPHRGFTQVDWVDGCIVANGSALSSIVGRSPGLGPEVWDEIPPRDNGFSHSISSHLARARVPVFVMERSPVLYTGEDPTLDSIMFTDGDYVAAALRRRERVVVGMSSEAGDMLALENAVTSLADQVDEIHVYLNGMDSVPAFMREETRCTVLCTEGTQAGYIGVSGRMYRFPPEGSDAYCFALDSRLVYPPGFIRYMVSKIEDYGREFAVTDMGYIVTKDAMSFIEDRVVIGEGDLDEDRIVTVPDGSVVAYHSSTMSVSRQDVFDEGVYACQLALAAANRGVEFIAVSHPDRWLLGTVARGDMDYDRDSDALSLSMESARAVESRSVDVLVGS